MIEEHLEEKTMLDIVRDALEYVKGSRWICGNISSNTSMTTKSSTITFSNGWKRLRKIC